MLGIMRKYKESIVIKIVFVVIVASFIGTIFLVWGRGSKGGGESQNFAAKVDGTKIPLEEFEKSYYRMRNMYEQIFGRSLSPEQEKQMNLKKMTLDNLIDNVLMRNEAKHMGLSVSKDEVANEISKIPSFQKDGAFDFNTYQQVLKMNRITPKTFEEAEEDDLLVKKARQKITSGITLTDQEIAQQFHKQNDKIDLAYVSFGPADVKSGIRLTDADLDSYLQAHQAEFRTPEEISVAFVRVSPEQFSSKVSVTPEEAQTYYQKNIDKYQGKGGILPFDQVKEQATADALKQKESKEAYEKAADAANKYKANGDIEGAASALGGKVEKTGMFTADAAPAALAGEKEVVARAFATKQGEIGGPVETSKGIYLVKVTERQPAAVPPLAKIRSKVEEKALAAKAVDVAQKKAQDTLVQLAKGNVAGMKETGNFGYDPAGKIPTIGTSPELEEQAFTLTTAAPVAKQAVKVGDRWYAVKLKSRIEAPATDLAGKREEIKKTLLPKKQQEAVDNWLKGLRGKAKIEINPLVLKND